MENDSSDSCIKATQILSNIINIYEGDSENKRKEFIQSILLTQYDSLPLITNFLIHKTDKRSLLPNEKAYRAHLL